MMSDGKFGEQASNDQWDLLLTHSSSCVHVSCCCRTFAKRFDVWSKRLPLMDDSDESWLWFCFSSMGQLRWLCLACHGDEYLNNKIADPAEAEPQLIKIGHLITHHNSTSHKECVSKMLDGNAKTSLAESQTQYTAPSKQFFIELLEAFQIGGTPTRGFDLASGRLAFAKANNMLWCLHEGLGDIRREFLVDAETSNIMRDERHSRMHVRIRVHTTESVVPYVGYLGQSRGHRPDAIGIAEGTVQIFKNACTSRANPPQGASPEVKPHFHQDAFDRACRSVEALSIDSAENEVVAGRDMASSTANGQFLNLQFTLRDGAHSARRLLSRLFKADELLSFVFDFFMILCSVIQWSDEMRAIYQACTNASTDAAVSTCFSHMRAAKHRIESWLTPLSRCCLDPTG
jgi:hypothetical protein